MATKVTPMQEPKEGWNFGDGDEVRRRKSRRATNDSELSSVHHRQADYPLSELNDLPTAKNELVTSHPHGGGGSAVNVHLFVLFKKLRNIDPKQSCADLSFIIALRWCAPELTGYKVEDQSKLWTPKIAVLNADRIVYTVEDPWYYPKTGDVRQIIHCEGTVANKSDLRYFPFDYETVSIKIAAEIGTGDRYVRLRWQNDTTNPARVNMPRTASSVTPPYVGNLHMEWQLIRGGNKIKREPKRQNVNGNFSAIQIELSLTRKYGFYMWKIMLLVVMIAIMSWSTFLIRDENGRLDDTEIFVMRLEFTAALLLAAVSFLYISQESIPRLSYLTSLDCMILYSFFNLFLVVIETVLIRVASQRSSEGGYFFKNPEIEAAAILSRTNGTATSLNVHNTAYIVYHDQLAMCIFPVVFTVIEIAIPIKALWQRHAWLKELKSHHALDGEVDKGLTFETWEEEWSWMKHSSEGKEKARRQTMRQQKEVGDAAERRPSLTGSQLQMFQVKNANSMNDKDLKLWKDGKDPSNKNYD